MLRRAYYLCPILQVGVVLLQVADYLCLILQVGKAILQVAYYLYPILQVVRVMLQVVGLGGSVGCAVRMETRRSRVQPPPRSATFFRGD